MELAEQIFSVLRWDSRPVKGLYREFAAAFLLGRPKEEIEETLKEFIDRALSGKDSFNEKLSPDDADELCAQALKLLIEVSTKTAEESGPDPETRKHAVLSYVRNLYFRIPDRRAFVRGINLAEGPIALGTKAVIFKFAADAWCGWLLPSQKDTELRRDAFAFIVEILEQEKGSRETSAQNIRTIKDKRGHSPGQAERRRKLMKADETLLMGALDARLASISLEDAQCWADRNAPPQMIELFKKKLGNDAHLLRAPDEAEAAAASA